MSNSSSSIFANATFGSCFSSFSFFLRGHYVAWWPNSPPQKHLIFKTSFFRLRCSCCPLDARDAFSSSSFGFVPLLLLPSSLHLTKSLLISCCWRATHIPSQFGNLSLLRILWTKTCHSSNTEFKAILTISVGWGVDPTAANESRISWSFVRNESTCSPFYICVDLIFYSKYIIHYSEDPSYCVANASHICRAISLLAMWHTTWSLTSLRINHLAFAISPLYFFSEYGFVGIATTLST